MKLISLLSDIFRSRGYEVMVSSPENSYLLLKRGSSTLAVGYVDPGHNATEGEVDMFLSMAENASADSTLFISPEKLKRASKKALEKGGSAMWDRMALAIAIGEQVITSTGEVEVEEGPVFDHQRILNMFKAGDVDPVAELRQFEKGSEPVFNVHSERSSKKEAVDISPQRSAVPLKVEKVSFPDTTEKKEEDVQAVSNVPEDILIGAWAGFEDWKKKEDKVPEPEKEEVVEQTDKPEEEAKVDPFSFDMPFMSAMEDTAPEKRPWVGATLAPTKCSREEACAKAGAAIDTEIEMEHVPNLLVSVSYSLRSEDGDHVSRLGQYLYDPIKAGLIDIPDALAEELRSTLSIWDGAGPANNIEKAKEDDKGYVRALKDRLVREKHAEDRLVRETLMSTIYQEVRYLFDPSTFDVRWSRRVVVPYWIKRDPEGRIKWMVDGYLGRFLPVGTGQ